MRRLLFITILCLALLPLAGAGHAQDTGSIPYFEFDDCPFLIPAGEVEGRTLECGYLITFEDPLDPDSEFIEIAVAILHQRGESSGINALIYLEGGPGGSALASVDAWTNSPLRDVQTIILLDQRGTGFSLPSLNCIEFDDPDSEDPDAACFDRLQSEGINIANYNTVNNASDINDLMIALEIDSANLLGISYGTRLGLAVMRDFPDRVRSVILDSTYPQSVNAYEVGPTNTEQVFRTLFNSCAADAACNAAYPDLENRFYEVVNRLNAEPATVTEVDDWTGEESEYDLWGDDLIGWMFSSMYDASLIPVLPAVVTYAYEGDYQEAVDLLTYGSPDEVFEETEDPYADYDEGEVEAFFDEVGSLGDAEGMFNALECQEEVAYNNVDDLYAAAEGVRPEIGDYEIAGGEDMYFLCETWIVEPAPAIENEAVVSDIPTLVLAGEFDPVTPPSWGAIAASTLSNSYFYTIPGLGHGVTDANDCVVSITQQFLANPMTEPDASCIAGLPGAIYYIR